MGGVGYVSTTRAPTGSSCKPWRTIMADLKTLSYFKHGQNGRIIVGNPKQFSTPLATIESLQIRTRTPLPPVIGTPVMELKETPSSQIKLSAILEWGSNWPGCWVGFHVCMKSTTSCRDLICCK